MNNNKDLINPNTADLQTLTNIPGVGPALAERIIAARPYESLDDLTRVNGVNQQALKKMKPFLTLREPINPNYADDRTLMTIPGIGSDLAGRIIAGRPYKSLDEMTRVSGISSRMLNRIKPFLTLEAVAAPIPKEGTTAVKAPPAPAREPVIELESTEKMPIEAEIVEAEEKPVPELEETSFEENNYAEALDFEEDYERAEPTPDIADEFFTDFEPQSGEDFPGPGEEPPLLSEEAPESHKTYPADLPAKQQVVTSQGVSRTEAITWSAGLSLLAMLLALVLSLGIIASLNGGSLQFITRTQFNKVALQVRDLETETNILATDLDGLRLRISALEALNGRVNNLERSLKTAQSDLEAAKQTLADTTSQVEALSDQVSGLAENLDEMQQRLRQAQNFFESLRDLLINLYPVEE